MPCRDLTELEQRTLLLYTGQTRDANTILERAVERHGGPDGVLREMRDLADEMRLRSTGEGDLDRFAACSTRAGS